MQGLAKNTQEKIMTIKKKEYGSPQIDIVDIELDMYMLEESPIGGTLPPNPNEDDFDFD